MPDIEREKAFLRERREARAPHTGAGPTSVDSLPVIERGPIRVTDAEREWLRKAAAILNGEDATPTVRRKAASVVRLVADRDETRRDRVRNA